MKTIVKLLKWVCNICIREIPVDYCDNFWALQLLDLPHKDYIENEKAIEQ